ncbi:acyltransferase family protein [Methyloversatilis sp.]|uniref:acyltransferase family protein n=1 Tax=Methyloversatilis sp. TaxID=2569862 RepID=UPI003F714A9E
MTAPGHIELPIGTTGAEADRPTRRTDARTTPDKLAVIDAARGWAILLVIVSHVGGLFPELPWPVKKLTNFGWFGVQLFFVVSAYTLLASWNRDRRALPQKTTDFLIRRFFRIAPMYYLGVVLYLFLRPPGERFSWDMLATTMLFVNAWTPEWLAVERGTWVVVPGGWSVSVEFMFYLVFPLFALLVSSLGRALCAVFVGAVVAAVSYRFGNSHFAGTVSDEALQNFLFFWPPSQLVVFAVGAVLFHAVARSDGGVRHVRVWMVALAVLLLLIAQFHFDKFWFVDGRLPPVYFLASVVFAALVSVQLRAARPAWLLVNPLICRLGEASFSAYVLHWAFLDLTHRFPSVIHADATGVHAIAAFLVALVAVTVAVYVAARATHLHFEQYFIRLGRRVGRRASGRADA